MTSTNFLKFSAASVAAMVMLVLSTGVNAQDIRSDVQKSILSCHDAVFYNNSNRNFTITYNYEYSGADGSRFTWQSQVFAPSGQRVVSYMPGQTVDCTKRYSVRVTNWQAR